MATITKSHHPPPPLPQVMKFIFVDSQARVAAIKVQLDYPLSMYDILNKQKKTGDAVLRECLQQVLDGKWNVPLSEIVDPFRPARPDGTTRIFVCPLLDEHRSDRNRLFSLYGLTANNFYREILNSFFTGQQHVLLGPCQHDGGGLEDDGVKTAFDFQNLFQQQVVFGEVKDALQELREAHRQKNIFPFAAKCFVMQQPLHTIKPPSMSHAMSFSSTSSFVIEDAGTLFLEHTLFSDRDGNGWNLFHETEAKALPSPHLISCIVMACRKLEETLFSIDQVSESFDLERDVIQRFFGTSVTDLCREADDDRLDPAAKLALYTQFLGKTLPDQHVVEKEVEYPGNLVFFFLKAKIFPLLKFLEDSWTNRLTFDFFQSVLQRHYPHIPKNLYPVYIMKNRLFTEEEMQRITRKLRLAHQASPVERKIHQLRETLERLPQFIPHDFPRIRTFYQEMENLPRLGNEAFSQYFEELNKAIMMSPVVEPTTFQEAMTMSYVQKNASALHHPFFPLPVQIGSIFFPSGLHYLFFRLYRAILSKTRSPDSSDRSAFRLLLAANGPTVADTLLSKVMTVRWDATFTASEYWSLFEHSNLNLYTRWISQIRDYKKTSIEKRLDEVIQASPVDFIIYRTRGIDPVTLLPPRNGNYDHDIVQIYHDLWSIDSPFLQSREAIYGKDILLIQKIVHTLHCTLPPIHYVHSSDAYELCKMIFHAANKFIYVNTKLEDYFLSPSERSTTFAMLFPAMAALLDDADFTLQDDDIAQKWMRESCALLLDKGAGVPSFLEDIQKFTVAARVSCAQLKKCPAPLFHLMIRFLRTLVSAEELSSSDVRTFMIPKFILFAEIFLGRDLFLDEKAKMKPSDFRYFSVPNAPSKNKNVDSEDIRQFVQERPLLLFPMFSHAFRTVEAKNQLIKELETLLPDVTQCKKLSDLEKYIQLRDLLGRWMLTVFYQMSIEDICIKNLTLLD